jgi:hypothetical protein
VTPRAITISPVNTRLARARALELRSNICAMNAIPACFSFIESARSTRGHGVETLDVATVQVVTKKCVRNFSRAGNTREVENPEKSI